MLKDVSDFLGAISEGQPHPSFYQLGYAIGLLEEIMIRFPETRDVLEDHARRQNLK